MIVYEGKRTEEQCIVTKREDDEVLPLLPRLDLWAHSHASFEWGYGGSGPAQLALALLADVLGDDEQAVELHQPFKWAVISRLPEREWQLRAEDVIETANWLQAEREAMRTESTE